jgi:hypothetical protein
MLFKQPLRAPESVSVLRRRSFAIFFAAQMVEDASDSIYLLVLPWLVLESGGSGTAIGLTGAAFSYHRPSSRGGSGQSESCVRADHFKHHPCGSSGGPLTDGLDYGLRDVAHCNSSLCSDCR